MVTHKAFPESHLKGARSLLMSCAKWLPKLGLLRGLGVKVFFWIGTMRICVILFGAVQVSLFLSLGFSENCQRAYSR